MALDSCTIHSVSR